MMQAVTQLAENSTLMAACNALRISRASLYRSRQPVRKRTVGLHPRALSGIERAEVISTLNNSPFIDCAPAAVYAKLLEDGVYMCSVSTMYRLLHAEKAVRERRDQRRRPHYSPPQLLAVKPNQVWSWDISKLLGPGKWEYFHLYVMLDIFSRYVVGWMVCERESGSLAEQLIATSCQRQDVDPHQLTIHSDNGPAMISKPVVELLHSLDVMKTVSRPYVSNDNPYSEAHFKTLKYRPCFPRRFGCIQDARLHLRKFFAWYNMEHRHSALGYMTPISIHDGTAAVLQSTRAAVLEAAFRAHPARFVRGVPKPPSLPVAAWINKPATDEQTVELLAAEEVSY